MGPIMLDDILARIFGNQWAVFLIQISQEPLVDLQQSIQAKQHIDP